jgi:hypothetical protein
MCGEEFKSEAGRDAHVEQVSLARKLGDIRSY